MKSWLEYIESVMLWKGLLWEDRKLHQTFTSIQPVKWDLKVKVNYLI